MRLFACALCAWAVASPTAIAQAPVEAPHVRVEIEADHRSVAPGEPVWVALVQHIDPGWHTYWVNPGDAGLATVIKWQLPDGFSVDAPAWPTPQVFRSGPVVTYGYEHRAVVLQRLHAPPALPAGPIRLSADLRWLACREACIPESATVSLALDRAATRRGMPDRAAAARIAAARAALPGPAPWQAMLSVRRDTLELTLHGLARDVPATATLHFVPLQWGQVDNAAEQRALRSGDDATLTLARGDLKDASLTSLEGLLLVDRGAANAGPRSYQVRAAAADPAAATEHLIPR